jgi:hypothetical protein
MDEAVAEGAGRAKTPVHLWIVGVLSLLWNFMGIFDYLMTKLEAEFYLSQFTEEQIAYFTGLPAWFTVFWALGVWGAFAGSIGLLLRKKWALWAFGVSLLGLVVSSIYSFGLSNGAEVMGTRDVIFTVVIYVVAIFLLLYSASQVKRGVLT